MNRKIALLIKIGISATLIYVLFNNIPFTEIRDAWLNFSALAVLAAALLHFVALLAGAIKWKIFLSEQSLARLLQFTLINSFYASVLPGQFTSEATKAYRLGQRTGNVGRVVISVWLDKMTGLWSLLILAITGFSFASVTVPLGIQITAIGLLVVTTICIYVVYSPNVARTVAVMFARKSIRWSEKLSYFLDKLTDKLNNFHGRPAQIIGSIFLGGVYQILSVGITIILARELGILISPQDWFWIFGVISVVQLMPISIGGLGVREVSFVGLLAIFGIESPVALVLSLSIFGLQTFYALIGAVIELHYTATLSKQQTHIRNSTDGELLN